MSEQAKKNELAIGIDLGTTYSVVAHLDSNGRPWTVLNSEGDLSTPSVVFFDKTGSVVGKEALKVAEFEPERIAQFAKRDMGAAKFSKTIREEDLPPEVIQALILEKLKADAELKVGSFTKAVVTVPAYFNEPMRKATQDAGRLAGLDVLDIINEPTAAALAFGVQQGFVNSQGETLGKETLLVYDLGGGTFDATLMQLDGCNYKALGTLGDVYLGGVDWDRRIIDYVAEQFREKFGIDPREDPCAMQSLLAAAEDAKRALSARAETNIHFALDGNRLRVSLTRKKFEEMTGDLLDRTLMTVRKLLAEAGLGWKEITRLLLVGGCSRMPMIQEMLEQESGLPLDRSLSPDEAIAHGAAIYAGLLLGSNDSDGPRMSVENVNSHDLSVLGVETSTGMKRKHVMIPRNSSLPATGTNKFKTYKDNQKNVKVTVIEGGDASGNNATLIGKCLVKELPPNLPAKTTVEVVFKYSENGRMSVACWLPTINMKAKLVIERASGLAPEKLQYWAERISEGLSDDSVADAKSKDSETQVDNATVENEPNSSENGPDLADNESDSSPEPSSVATVESSPKPKQREPKRRNPRYSKLDSEKSTEKKTGAKTAKTRSAAVGVADAAQPTFETTSSEAATTVVVGIESNLDSELPVNGTLESLPRESDTTTEVIEPTADVATEVSEFPIIDTKPATHSKVKATPDTTTEATATEATATVVTGFIEPSVEGAQVANDSVSIQTQHDSKSDLKKSKATTSPPRMVEQTTRKKSAKRAGSAVALVIEERELDEEELAELARMERKRVIKAVSITVGMHAVLLFILALIILPEVLDETFSIITSNMPVDEIVEPLDDPVELEIPEEITDDTLMEVVNDVITDSNETVEIDISDLPEPSTTIPDPFANAPAPNAKITGEMGGRSKAGRTALLNKYGGNAASEQSVRAGLEWLKRHQLSDGSWSFVHTHAAGCDCADPGRYKKTRMASTGFAIMAFLGAGHTYAVGNFRPEVMKGLEYIFNNMKQTSDGIDVRGDFEGNTGMYTQGIVTIALCEALAMSEMHLGKSQKSRREKGAPRVNRADVTRAAQQLRFAAKGAVDFISMAQHQGGGWRYKPRDAGDTSVVGWQIMALVSGRSAGLKVSPNVFQGATVFLNAVQSNGGVNYGYTGPKRSSPATSAIGLLCRMYLGWDHKTPALKNGAAYIGKVGPQKNNMYFNYYATQVMHHWGGDEWKKWNKVMRDQLVNTQLKTGHAAGSWSPVAGHGKSAGRHYMTCMSVMTLEVYYRHMPLYSSLETKTASKK